MSLSDCEKCWDTPCECGNYGYMVVRAKPENYKRLQDLPREEFDRLRTFLAHILNAALNPAIPETSHVEIPVIDVDIKVVPLDKKAETRCPARSDLNGRQCTREMNHEGQHASEGCSWSAEPVCKTCNDTHRFEIEGGRLAGRIIMCGQCPIPCDMCRGDKSGGYCDITPCPCSCHKKAR